MRSKNFYKFQVNEWGSQRINYAYLCGRVHLTRWDMLGGAERDSLGLAEGTKETSTRVARAGQVR